MDAAYCSLKISWTLLELERDAATSRIHGNYLKDSMQVLILKKLGLVGMNFSDFKSNAIADITYSNH